jgi:hypothetical protein
MTLEDLLKEITKLSVDDRGRLRELLEQWTSSIESLRSGDYSAKLSIDSGTYGRIEGTLYFTSLLREVCSRFQHKAFPKNVTGKTVNDGPTIIASGNGAGGVISQRIDGPLDGSSLSALEHTAFNILSDSRRYEGFFRDTLERFAAHIEDLTMQELENTQYRGPTRLEERTLHYSENKQKRRDNTYRPRLKDNQKLPVGRRSERTEFETNLETARRSLRRSEIKLTQERLAEKMGYESGRSLRSRLRAYGMRWSDIKNRK